MTEPVVLYPGFSGWHFVGVTKKFGKEIKENFGKNCRGFGSLRVMVTVGKTSWQTSIFPDKASGTYVLPIKAFVRKRENIEAGDRLTYQLKLIR